MKPVISRALPKAPTPVSGWPRPRGRWSPDERRISPRDAEPEVLPIPWVLDRKEDGAVAWTVFHGQAHTAHHQRLCQVCGEKLGNVILLGLAEDTGNEGPRTSGPGCHPRCMALTLSFCPHFRDLPEDEVVAYAHSGPGTGYRVFDEPDEAEPTPTQIEEVYTISTAILPGAEPMTSSQVKDLAKRDPLGAGLDECPSLSAASPVSAVS